MPLAVLQPPKSRYTAVVPTFSNRIRKGTGLVEVTVSGTCKATRSRVLLAEITTLDVPEGAIGVDVKSRVRIQYVRR